MPLPCCPTPYFDRLVRKTLLVPPTMPADKRRALQNRGGELPPRPDLAPRPRPSARFTLVSLGWVVMRRGACAGTDGVTQTVGVHAACSGLLTGSNTTAVQPGPPEAHD